MRRLIESVVDNGLNFAWQLAAGAACGLAAASLLRRRHCALAAGGALAVLAATIGRSARYRLEPDPSGPPLLRVMTLNAYNRGVAIEDRVTAFAREHEVDVLLLQEWDVPASATRGAIDGWFPHHAVEAPDGTQIYARRPFRVLRVERLDDSPHQESIITVGLEAGGVELTLIAAHPLQPVHPRRFAARRREFDRLAEIAGGFAGPVVVAGDCNASILSPDFQRLLARAGLRSVSAWPPRGTWPAPLGATGIAIDHVLVRGLRAASFWVGPSLGSDHRAVVADLARIEG
ncbi:MAG: endonuclease/exonuclease/phosphatase family protein [Dehalococcoidia bacterium]